MQPIDPAILQALSLHGNEKHATTITSHGGSNFTETYKLHTKDGNGVEKCYFVKIGKGEENRVMFTGEHLSLTLIHATVPHLCPTSYSHGPLTLSPGSYYLLTSFLSSSSSFTTTTPLSPPHTLSQKLATLHSIPAPTPPGHKTQQFGFSVPTSCGNTIQNNNYRSSWSSFFAECRIGHIWSQIKKRHGEDIEMGELVRGIIEDVIPRLLSEGHLTSPSGVKIEPVLVHGDLWSGNWGRFNVAKEASAFSSHLSGEQRGEGEEEVEEMIFDPSSCYAHSEYEFGIMRMFGGFGSEFENEYWKLKAKDKPVDEWEDRATLYELYHHLNHYSMFGGSYKGSAVRIMKSLIDKYGGT